MIHVDTKTENGVVTTRIFVGGHKALGAAYVTGESVGIVVEAWPNRAPTDSEIEAAVATVRDALIDNKERFTRTQRSDF